jgi:hypothetical protein
MKATLGRLLLLLLAFPATNHDSQHSVLDRSPNGNISAHGSWVEVSEKKMPNRVVEIDCVKSSMKCDWASASVINGRASLDVGTFEILKWDTAELIAKAIFGSRLDCYADALIMDFHTNSVMLTQVPKIPADKSCADMFKSDFVKGDAEANGSKTNTYTLRATHFPNLADLQN